MKDVTSYIIELDHFCWTRSWLVSVKTLVDHTRTRTMRYHRPCKCRPSISDGV